MSLSTGITNSMNTSASAQSSFDYDSSSSSTLVLDGGLTNNSLGNISTTANAPSFNSSLITIGNPNSTDPVKLAITTSSLDENGSSSTNPTSLSNSSTTSNTDYLESDAVFEASGFSSLYDLRLKGASSPDAAGTLNDAGGTVLRSDVRKLSDKQGTVGTANSSSNAQSKTNLQADITRNDFTSVFISSF